MSVKVLGHEERDALDPTEYILGGLSIALNLRPIVLSVSLWVLLQISGGRGRNLIDNWVNVSVHEVLVLEQSRMVPIFFLLNMLKLRNNLSQHLALGSYTLDTLDDYWDLGRETVYNYRVGNELEKLADVDFIGYGFHYF